MKRYVWIIASAVLFTGCTATPEEASTPQETTQETTASEQASTPEASNEKAVSCGGFGSPSGAEQFFFSSASPDQKASLDKDGNGFPCDEPGNKTNPKLKAKAKPKPKVDPVMDLLECQAEEVEKDLGVEKGTRLVEELFDEALQTGGISIQELLAERGYTCGGTADDILKEQG